VNDLNLFLNSTPNYIIALVFAGTAALLSILIFIISRELVSVTFEKESSDLAIKVQTSLLGFAVLILAFSIGDARSNLTKANDAVDLEASQISHVGQLLFSYGNEETIAAHNALINFASSVVNDEWPLLSEITSTGSPKTDAALRNLFQEVSNLKPTAKHQESVKVSLDTNLEALHKSRDSVIDKANNQVPALFWVMIISLVVVSMAFNFHYKLTKINCLLIGSHMATVGIAIALLAMLDAPFRGQTAVSSDRIANQISKLNASAIEYELKAKE